MQRTGPSVESRRAIASGLFALVLLVGAMARGSSPQANPPDSSPKIDWSGLLPEGEGRAEVALSCSTCHDLRPVMMQKKTRSNWNQTVQKMIHSYQAPVDDQDFQMIVSYLSKNFGETNPIEQLPMNINTASPEALARLPGISSEMALAIVECRQTKGPFASVDDLSRIQGIEKTTLDRIKPYITIKN